MMIVLFFPCSSKNKSTIFVYLFTETPKLFIIRPGHGNIKIIVPRHETVVTQSSDACAARCPPSEVVFFTNLHKFPKNVKKFRLKICDAI